MELTVVAYRLTAQQPLLEQPVQPTLASFQSQNKYDPSPPTKLIKTPVRVTPLAFGVCGVCINRQ